MAFHAEIAHSIGLTANAVSIIGVILAVVASFFYFLGKMNGQFVLMGIVLLLLSGFCDALDGVLARIYGRATSFGGFLDSLLDRYADAFIIAAITAGGLCNLHVGFLALIGSLLVSYTRARAEGLGVKMEGVGLAERAERIVIISVSSIAFLLYGRTLWYDLTFLGLGMTILAVLTHVTVFQRTFYFYRRST